jgi:hypothetical protein
LGVLEKYLLVNFLILLLVLLSSMCFSLLTTILDRTLSALSLLILLKSDVDTQDATNTQDAVNAVRFITVIVAPAHDPTTVSVVVAVPLVVLNPVSTLVVDK